MSRVKFSWCQVERGRREGEGKDHFTGSFQETGQNLEHSREKAQEEEQERKRSLESSRWAPGAQRTGGWKGAWDSWKLWVELSREGGRR